MSNFKGKSLILHCHEPLPHGHLSVVVTAPRFLKITEEAVEDLWLRGHFWSVNMKSWPWSLHWTTWDPSYLNWVSDRVLWFWWLRRMLNPWLPAPTVRIKITRKTIHFMTGFNVSEILEKSSSYIYTWYDISFVQNSKMTLLKLNMFLWGKIHDILYFKLKK